MFHVSVISFFEALFDVKLTTFALLEDEDEEAIGIRSIAGFSLLL